MTHSDHSSARTADEAAIGATLRQLVAAWNRGDGVAYGALFTTDADYIDVTGTHTTGAEAIGRLHTFLFEGPLKGSQLEGAYGQTPGEVQFLAPDVALVIGGGTTRLAGQTEAPEDRGSINTTVLVKRDSAWRIRAFQNNRVQRRPGTPPSSTGSQGSPERPGTQA